MKSLALHTTDLPMLATGQECLGVLTVLYSCVLSGQCVVSSLQCPHARDNGRLYLSLPRLRLRAQHVPGNLVLVSGGLYIYLS